MTAEKFDSEKPRMELIDPSALEGLARVLTFGAKKYAPENWRKGLAWSRLVGAAMRHLMAFARGEDVDAESGLPHLDHLACCVMFLSASQKLGHGTDDRVKRILRIHPGLCAVVNCKSAPEEGSQFCTWHWNAKP